MMCEQQSEMRGDTMEMLKSRRGVIDPISVVAIVGMVTMMGAMMGFMIWGMPKMMGMMHGGHDDKQHEAASKEHDAHATKAVDPVCGMDVELKDDTPRITLRGKTYYFCSEDDLKKFAADPEKFVSPK